MFRKILTIALFIAMLYAFGCKKESPQTAPSQSAVDVKKQAEQDVTKENMEQQLEKIEDEIRQDVIQTEPNV